MRSRYTAFALGDADYLWRTWHPRTRPEKVTIDPAVEWTGLQIIEAAADEVEFEASSLKATDERLREEQRANEPGRCMSSPGSL